MQYWLRPNSLYMPSFRGQSQLWNSLGSDGRKIRQKVSPLEETIYLKRRKTYTDKKQFIKSARIHYVYLSFNEDYKSLD